MLMKYIHARKQHKRMKLSKQKLAILGLIIANIIWGAASPIFKWSLQDIQPFTLAFLRFSIAALLFLPFVYKNIKIKKQDIPVFVIMGLLGITTHITLFFFGLRLTSSINAPIIASAGPVFLIFAGILFFKEHPSRRKIVGSILGFFGLVLIIIMPIVEKGFQSSFLGDSMLIVATLVNVWFVVEIKKKIPHYPTLTLVFWIFLFGSLGFLPFFALEVTQYGFLTDINMQGIVGLVFGIFFSSFAAYALFFLSIRYLMLLDVGIFTYLDPIVAIMIAVPLLHEIPTPIYVVGSLFVFLGIYIAEKRIPYHPIHRLR